MAAGIVSPLPEGWEQQANDGVAWARQGGLVERIGQVWSLTDTGRQELAKTLEAQQAEV